MSRAWFPCYPGDLLGSLRWRMMTPAERGAYWQLICWQMQSDDGHLPGDGQSLGKLADYDVATSPAIMDAFPIAENGKRANPRALAEWGKRAAISVSRSSSGRTGMAHRWQPDNKPDNKPITSVTTPDNKPITSVITPDNKPITSVTTSTSTSTTTATPTSPEGECAPAGAVAPPAPVDQPKPAMQRPDIDQATAYGREIGMATADIGSFMDYYAANGWRVGRVAMKDWRAAMRNWKRRSFGTTGGNRRQLVGGTGQHTSADAKAEDFI